MELHDILLAADVIENRFPPKNLEDVMSLLAFLNLLNAAVKMPIGEGVTTYSYIKGHVGLLFIWLLDHPVEGVDIYYDKEGSLTYFKVPGYQFSFHQVPFLAYYIPRFTQLVMGLVMGTLVMLVMGLVMGVSHGVSHGDRHLG